MVLENEMTRLKEALSSFEASNAEVSKKGVNWHVDHSLKVINGVFLSMKKSDPKEYKSKFSIIKLYVMGTGKIPRGKAKAPKKVVPPENISKDKVVEQYEQALENIKNLSAIDSEQFFPHPLFGDLKKKKTIQFLGIHTRHHLKIIDDILQ